MKNIMILDKVKYSDKKYNYYDFIGNSKNQWDRIYGDKPKEKIILSKPVTYYIDAINKIIDNNIKILFDYFPHLNHIINFIQKENINNIIDIGCGSGIYSYVIFKVFGANFNYYLLDISQNALFEALKLFGYKDNIYYVRADVFSIPFLDKSIDIGITGGLLEHFNFFEQKNILKEIDRVCKIKIHQYPLNNVIYWLQRMIISLFNKGRWPFGKEVPISKKREKKLFNIIEEVNYSYTLKRLEFRYLVRNNLVIYKILRGINKLPIYKMFYSDKCVMIK